MRMNCRQSPLRTDVARHPEAVEALGGPRPGVEAAMTRLSVGGGTLIPSAPERTRRVFRCRAFLRPGRILSRGLRVVVRVVPVLNPLVQVAVHVVQAPGIGLVGADRDRAKMP